MTVPPPPQADLTVARHVISAAGAAQPLFHFAVEDVEPDSSYVIEAWIWIAEAFDGTELGLVLLGYATESYLPVNLEIREQWQKISVTARVPPGQRRAVPSLRASGAIGSEVFSCGWQIRPLVLSSRVATSRAEFKVVALNTLLRLGLAGEHGLPRIAAAPCLPDVDVAIPPVAFGQMQRPQEPVWDWPPDSWDQSSYSIRGADSYTLRDAVVHGEQGIVTVGDYLIEETLYLAHPDLIGFEKSGEDRYRLKAGEPHCEMDKAAHLMCGYVGNRNYAHWWVDTVPALLVPPFHGAFAGRQLLWPKLRNTWQRETLALLPEASPASVFVGENTRIFCRDLCIVPQITQSDHAPHPFRSVIIQALRERAGHFGHAGKRIYISRQDSSNRRLVNEAAVIAMVSRYGFEPVTLAGKTVAEQIRLFASASHVIGAHGAGLANVIFCLPGATLFEFHMRSNIHWSIRRLAALSRMSYGCIVGTAVDDSVAIHQRDWSIDPAVLEAALATDAFAC